MLTIITVTNSYQMTTMCQHGAKFFINFISFNLHDEQLDRCISYFYYCYNKLP